MPLLAGYEFYTNFTDYVDQILFNRNSVTIHYTFQTNGVLISDEFAIFFKQNNFLIGISLDGTKDVAKKISSIYRGYVSQNFM